jgi:hypothetical protein
MSESIEGRTARAGYANYKGDVSSIVGEVHGPNELREFVTAVEAKYDTENNSTRVGFDFARPTDMKGI